MSMSTNEVKVAIAQEAAKIVVALIDKGPGAFCGAGADEAGRRAAKAFETVFNQIQAKVG